jgi:hypothetical protein
MPFDVTVFDQITLVELKTIGRAVDWDRVAVVLGSNDGSSRTARLQLMIRGVRKAIRDTSREWLRAIEACLKLTAKTPTVAYYVKLIASRGLQRMRDLLRQKLTSSAPVDRLILRNRPRQLFAARPPVAPPHFA